MIRVKYPQPSVYVVRQRTDTKVRVSPDYTDYGPWMPIESLPHFEADLNGRVPDSVLAAWKHNGNWSGHPAIDAVLSGYGQFLGKGDDGVVWRVGSFVVKGSTTVPFQPMNPGHRTPKEAMQMMNRQWKIVNRLRKSGIPHLPKTELFFVGDKAFEVKNYYRLLSKLNKHQLDQITLTIGDLHNQGYVVGDTIQVGVDDKDNVWFFDLGKIRKGKLTHSWNDDFDSELRDVERLYQENGFDFVPPPGPIFDRLWVKALDKKRPWFSYDKDDLIRFRVLAKAAISYEMANAKEDTKIMEQYINASLKKQEKR